MVSNPWLCALAARRGRRAKEKAPREEQSGRSQMPEQEEGTHGVSAKGERGGGGGEAPWPLQGPCAP